MPTHTLAHDLQMDRIFPESSFNYNRTPIQEFYSRKCIVITGATGFIGKVLLERLLTLYPDIDTIYILVREKKGHDVKKRLDDLFKSPVFSNLSESSRNKIVAIEGELGEPNLSMKEEDRLLLIRRANIMFHCAATVRFDEKLKLAIKINMIGTRDIINLCKEMNNFEALLHVSTAFSNCDKSLHIEEKFYKSGMNPDDATNFLNLSDKTTLDIVTPRLLKNYANTYAYTKSSAESIIKNEAAKLPVAIFRPGIVTGASEKYPFKGFVDNYYGPSGITVGVGMGVLRTMQNKGTSPSHMIPVDYCVNVMIAATWDVAQQNHASPPIYNYVPSMEDNINWKTFTDLTITGCLELPPSKGLWWPDIILTKYKTIFHILFVILHIIPAVVVDIALKIAGKKPILLGVQRKTAKFLKLLEYYLKYDWTFQLDGVVNLESRLSPKDRESLYTDMTNFDWKSFSYSFLYGVGVYLMNESPANIEQSKIRLQKLKHIHYITMWVFATISFYFSWNFIKYYWPSWAQIL